MSMTKVRKVPYYTMERSLFRGRVWKGYYGSLGAVPINTPQTISLERLAPGEKPPPPPPKAAKPTTEQIKQKKLEDAQNKALAELQKKQQLPKPKEPEPPKSKVLEAEDKEKLPDFDIQDIPSAMQKMGWPVAAKLSQRWFNSQKLIWNNDKKAVLPIDDTSVTLDWVLKFGLVEWEYNKLLSDKIYNENAISELKLKLKPILEKNFLTASSLSFDTTPYLNDLRSFHLDWNFQRVDIANYETLTKSVSMTDLTAALANFGIYAAIGHVGVVGDKYFKYDNEKQLKTYCFDPKVVITHIYVYVKDNYSFNDDPHSKKTQYLGHWNKNGMVVTTGGTISDIVDGKQSLVHTDMGNSKSIESHFNWDYLISKPLDKPVDTRRGTVRKFREEDVYFPVYNKNFNEWREKHNRGGDFWIYSKPRYMKLKRPIEFSLNTICRQSEKM